MVVVIVRRVGDVIGSATKWGGEEGTPNTTPKPEWEIDRRRYSIDIICPSSPGLVRVLFFTRSWPDLWPNCMVAQSLAWGSV